MPENFIQNSEDIIEEIQVPDTFSSLDEFEHWLHSEICMRGDISLGEIVGIFSPEGRYIDKIIIPLSIGSASGINLTHNLDDRESELVRGNITSHNHPSNSSFSFKEILTAADLSLTESRIITQDWVYVIRPINNQWSSVDLMLRINDEIDRDVTLDYCITQPLLNPEWKHQRYQILADRAGFYYERIRFP